MARPTLLLLLLAVSLACARAAPPPPPPCTDDPPPPVRKRIVALAQHKHARANAHTRASCALADAPPRAARTYATHAQAEFSCAQQAVWGKCNDTFLADFCHASCARCVNATRGPYYTLRRVAQRCKRPR
jgi:hypothetical protein